MNFVNLTKWIRERILPSLPPNSVVVIDNVPYHGEQEDKSATAEGYVRVIVETRRSVR